MAKNIHTTKFNLNFWNPKIRFLVTHFDESIAYVLNDCWMPLLLCARVTRHNHSNIQLNHFFNIPVDRKSPTKCVVIYEIVCMRSHLHSIEICCQSEQGKSRVFQKRVVIDELTLFQIFTIGFYLSCFYPNEI